MRNKLKEFLKMLFHMVLAGFITNVAYIATDAIFRAVVNDLSKEMTFGRSVLYLIFMIGLQFLYCFLFTRFRYGTSKEGVDRLTADCKEEPYGGLRKDMAKLFRKERTVLYTSFALITLAMLQAFLPVGLMLTQLFIGVSGPAMVIPDLLVFLFASDPTAVDLGLYILFWLIGLYAGMASFCGMYLCYLSRKRKKWCDEWRI